MARIPKNYQGIAPTGRGLNQILPDVLKNIEIRYTERPNLVLESWPKIIGEKLAAMTEAISFKEGILTVKVKNSTLHSLLTTQEKGRLLKKLREHFPNVTIRNISFRIG